MRCFLFSTTFPFGPISRRELLAKTIIVESGLVLLALLLDGAAVLYAYFFQETPGPSLFAKLNCSWSAFAYGSFAALPPLLLLFFIDRFPVGPLRKVKDISEQFLRPILRNCKWPDFFLLSALAGFCEELLFRGWMQPFFAQWLPHWGSNLLVGFLFACCHAITPTYFIIAWLISLYFGGLLLWTDNLFVPMVTHGMYDLIALFAVMYSRNQTSNVDTAAAEGDEERSSDLANQAEAPAESLPIVPPSEPQL